jgi:uncharacterized protein YecT (DUF1311 family)
MSKWFTDAPILVAFNRSCLIDENTREAAYEGRVREGFCDSCSRFPPGLIPIKEDGIARKSDYRRNVTCSGHRARQNFHRACAGLAGVLLCAIALESRPAQAQDAPAINPGPAWVTQQVVDPPVYRGHCPALLRFTAEIRKGAWGPVRYHWVKSDGTRTTSESVEFHINSPPQQVSTIWSVDPEPGEQIWASLVIEEPEDTTQRVGKAVAKVVCTTSDARSTADEAVPRECMRRNADEPLIGSKARQCELARVRLARSELDRLFHTLETTLEPPDSEGPPDDAIAEGEAKRLRYLRESQHVWDSFVRNACEEVYYSYWPGSMSEDARLECMYELTRQRIDYIRKRIED